jgi:hypothetical protein
MHRWYAQEATAGRWPPRAADLIAGDDVVDSDAAG